MVKIGGVYGTKKNWRVLRLLGRGGQGMVYEVEDVTGVDIGDNQVAQFGHALAEFDRVHGNREEREKATSRIIGLIRGLVRENYLPKGAMKELLPLDEAINAKAALSRMKTEIEVARKVTHPALIKVLDDDIESQRFVVEYFPDGPLAKGLGRFQGRVLDALRAFQPIVEAVAALHKSQVVHRDIKPENVFVRADGNLVLGDLGLAIKLEAVDRITDTFENVGTRDYQPPWSYGMRLQDVKPNFDVFGLGKLLWAMVSGRPRFPLWYFDEGQHDLRSLLPGNPGVFYVQRILKKCVVQREEQCTLKDGQSLLEEVDESIAALQLGGEVPSQNSKMRCRFCGFRGYSAVSELERADVHDPSNRFKCYVCDSCGHVESFLWRDNQPPLSWQD